MSCSRWFKPSYKSLEVLLTWGNRRTKREVLLSWSNQRGKASFVKLSRYVHRMWKLWDYLRYLNLLLCCVRNFIRFHGRCEILGRCCFCRCWGYRRVSRVASRRCSTCSICIFSNQSLTVKRLQRALITLLFHAGPSVVLGYRYSLWLELADSGHAFLTISPPSLFDKVHTGWEALRGFIKDWMTLCAECWKTRESSRLS